MRIALLGMGTVGGGVYELAAKKGIEVVRVLEASFPLEIFLLMGDRYVSDAELGRACHLKRVAFEANLRAQGKTKEMRDYYRALAGLNLGRQVVAFAVAR